MISEKELIEAQDAYYAGNPLMTDLEYDRVYNEFAKAFPDSIAINRVGGSLDNTFEEVQHTIPMLSLDKVYTAEDMQKFISSVDTPVVAEPKIDGISIVIYYEEGKLLRAVTRGNGSVGNDVTKNVLTIKNVPTTLSEAITVAVRGEIYLPKSEFEKLNATSAVQYANCRNLTAGLMRTKDSSKLKGAGLDIFIYEGYFENSSVKTHMDTMAYLEKLGFKINSYKYMLEVKLEDEIELYRNMRPTLDYDIDGIVFKVNDLSLREELGFTGHHPRWAMAYKFESPQAVSVVESIEVQVGRTGKITPVANIKPTELAGSVISRVTLHNQDYINALELGIGDEVSISKRGDVIPAVDEVLFHEGTVYQMPTTCPSCGETLEREGAHLFCKNRWCPAKLLGRLVFFTGKNQMDIDGLGETTIKYLFDNFEVFKDGRPMDLYFFDYDLLLGHEGFGEKKVQKIKDSLKATYNTPLSRVLASFGAKGLGHKNAKLIVNHYNNLGEILDMEVEDLVKIEGIGQSTAEDIVKYFDYDDVDLQLLVLRDESLGLPYDKEVANSGPVFCITGTFDISRGKIETLIKSNGGKVSKTVSSKVDYLVCGNKAGSKKAKAEKLGIRIISPDNILSILEQAIRNK